METSSISWFYLSLLCAFSLASADALTKKFFPNYSGWQLLIVRFVVPGLLLLPGTFIYPLPSVPPVFWLWIVILIPFELLAMWLYMLAIRDSPLHLTLPYLAFTPAFNVLTGFTILGETVSATGFGGILLVVAGAYFLNIEKIRGSQRSWLAPFVAIIRIRGSRYMLGVAAIYSLTSVLGKRAMLYATPASFGPFYFSMLGGVVLGATLLLRPTDLRTLLRKGECLLLIGICMAVMIITHFLAIASVEVAYFLSLKRTSLLFGVVYGALLFKEGHLGRHLIGGILMVAGVALIMIS